MAITGTISCVDNPSAFLNRPSNGITAYVQNIDDSDNQDSTVYAISGSRRITTDQTFLQGSILGQGDLTLTLSDWTYFGGYQRPDTTWVDGTWMSRWFEPEIINYSLWYKNYDTSQYSLVGYKYRDPIEKNIGSFYAPMVVPNTVGHYEARWLYFKDVIGFGQEVVQPFTSLSRGIDAMRDFPYHAGSTPYPYTPDNSNLGAIVMTIPVYNYKNIGESAMFTLQINGGLPAPISYHWRMNGNNLTNDGTKFSGVYTDTLVISNLTMAEAGLFNCVVSDSIVSTAAYIVLDPP